MTILEFNKVSNGPLMPDPFIYNENRPTYYGIWDITSNGFDSCVGLINYSFTNANGNGVLASSGVTDINTWSTTMIQYFIKGYQETNRNEIKKTTFRYVRSAE